MVTWVPHVPAVRAHPIAVGITVVIIVVFATGLSLHGQSNFVISMVIAVILLRIRLWWLVINPNIFISPLK